MWVEAFLAGIIGTSDDQRCVRHFAVTDKFHVEKVNELLNKTDDIIIQCPYHLIQDQMTDWVGTAEGNVTR